MHHIAQLKKYLLIDKISYLGSDTSVLKEEEVLLLAIERVYYLQC